MNACMQDNDPIGLAINKAILGISGVPIPKVLVARLAEAVGDHQLANAIRGSLRLSGVSRFTTLPSALSAKLRAARSTKVLRAFGRAANAALIAYGLALAAVETHCASFCAGCSAFGVPQYDPLEGNVLDSVRRAYF